MGAVFVIRPVIYVIPIFSVLDRVSHTMDTAAVLYEK